jgi:CBS domain-containing protein
LAKQYQNALYPATGVWLAAARPLTASGAYDEPDGTGGHMRVRDAMSKPVWTCLPDESAQAAVRLMWDRDVGAVPIVDAGGQLVGIVTDRDLCMLTYFTGSTLAQLPVSQAMAHRVFTVDPDATVTEAERTMRAHQVRRLPVVEEGTVVGILSLGDIARAEASAGAAGGRGTFADVVSDIALPREHVGRPAREPPPRR